MELHYLEIVSLDTDSACKAYEAINNVNFSEPDPLLGGARTCTLTDGSIVGVRSPMRETEEPVVRPYWLVENIEQAVTDVEACGAQIARNPMEIPGKGKFAIYILGGHEQGFWEL